MVTMFATVTTISARYNSTISVPIDATYTGTVSNKYRISSIALSITLYLSI